MAGIDVISAAGSALEEKALALISFVEVCEGLDEGAEHRWVYVVGGLARALDEAVQAHVQAVNRHAMPHLRDLAVFGTNGGMGAVAPMATKVMAGQSAPSRA